MLIHSNEFISNAGKMFGVFFLIGIISLFVILSVFSLTKIIILLKDQKSLKSKNFITIIGKVIRFKRNREPESGVQINDKPVVSILDTNEEIELIINDTIMIGEIYKFNYLKNSKIAEVVEHVEKKQHITF